MSLYRNKIIADGAVAYWRLGENSGTTGSSSIIDVLGTYHGTPSNVTFGISGALYENNTAASFDGTNSVINCGTTSPVGTGDKSITAWIKPSTLKQCGILDKDFDNGGSNYGGWGLWMNGSGKLWWWNHANKDLIDNGSLSVSTGIWQHVAVTWDATNKNAKFYINGNLSSSQTNVTISENSSGSVPMTIGDMRNNTAGSFRFNGSIDEVAIFSNILNSNQIYSQYRAGKGFLVYNAGFNQTIT